MWALSPRFLYPGDMRCSPLAQLPGESAARTANPGASGLKGESHMLQGFHMEQPCLLRKAGKKSGWPWLGPRLDALRHCGCPAKGNRGGHPLARKRKSGLCWRSLGGCLTYLIIPQEEGALCARTACQLVRDGQADIPCKGPWSNGGLYTGNLDKKQWLVPERGLLSQATLLELPEEEG